MKRTLQFATLVTLMSLAFSSKVFAQVKIGSNPTTIEATSNLEVEASTANRKIKVNKTSGQLTIQDGTEGNGRILVSDSVGGASWKDLKTTSTFTVDQNPGAGQLITIRPGSAICGDLSCAIDLNMTGTLTIEKPVSDAIIDFSGNYNLAFNNGRVQFLIFLAIDKGSGFEVASQFFVSESGLSCNANYMFFRTILQNLPPKTYNLRVFVAPWFNEGSVDAKLGIGSPSNPGFCGGPAGADLTGTQKLVVSVSQ